MRWMKAAFAATVVSVSSGLLVFCVGDTTNPGQDASTKDSGGDAGADVAPPAQGFTLTLTPIGITTDPGDSNIKIDVGVVRAAGFTDDVSFTVSAPTHVTATTPVDTGNGGTSSSFLVSVDATAPLGDLTLTVTAANPTKSFVQNAPLTIRVGSLVDFGDGGFTVPSWTNALIVKAWGAGGGASCQTCTMGGTGGGEPGGGGGFASATVAVTPGANLVAVVGTGAPAGFYAGADSGCPNQSTGAGGGGFSGLQVKGGNYLVIAGGGGGAAFYTYAGAGGGASGEDCPATSDAGCFGRGGTQDAGGGSYTFGTCGNPGQPGSSLHGGNGYTLCSVALGTGGTPGGGNGASTSLLGTGGGGGGYFGGGGGGGPFGGGGGGSGFVASDAGVLMSGSGGSAANTSDPDFAAHCASGAAAGGVPSTNSGVGGNGCLVIRLSKP